MAKKNLLDDIYTKNRSEIKNVISNSYLPTLYYFFILNLVSYFSVDFLSALNLFFVNKHPKSKRFLISRNYSFYFLYIIFAFTFKLLVSPLFCAYFDIYIAYF